MCGNLSTPADEWLAQQFECEFCAECGGDACHHTAVPFMGNWFARCDYPPNSEDEPDPVIRDYHNDYGKAEK